MKIFCKIASVLALLTSCTTVIPIPEDDLYPEKGNIPITIQGSISSLMTTRVADNTFEEGDKVGVFATIDPEVITGNRYLDNNLFTYTASGFEASVPAVYPEGDVKLNFISYFPYQEKGAVEGEATIQVSVLPDQNKDSDYGLSDFLIARTTNVTPSKTPVNLIYKHQFARLKVTLTPTEPGDLDNLYNQNPQVSITGMNTSGIYNLQNGNISSLSNPQTIHAHGTWAKEADKLSGLDFILIPQTVDKEEQEIIIEAGGRIYHCQLPANLKLLSGKQCEINIPFDPSSANLISTVTGKIEDWTGEDKWEGEEVTPSSNKIDLSVLSFRSSDIYNVVSQGRKVAEICKEYLLADNIDAEAIVVYPVPDGKNADLTQGVVMQVTGQQEAVHGGTVSWNIGENKLTYTPGNKSVQTAFYVTTDYEISLTAPGTSLSAQVSSYVINDIRNQELRTYPVVKIGVQYWMKENLATTCLTDGSAIEKFDNMGSEENKNTQKALGSGYLKYQQAIYYSPDVVRSGKIAPIDWAIPTWKDWNALTAYLKGDMSALKSGTWLPSGEEEAAQATNRSGFNAQPTGLYYTTECKSYYGKYAFYWAVDEEGKLGEETSLFALQNSTNEVGKAKFAETKACTIRCIKK